LLFKWGKLISLWIQLFAKLPSILAGALQRIDQLEMAVFHGQKVRTIFVPEGMDPQEAWKRYGSGIVTSDKGTYVTVLEDNSGNLLRVYTS
jgi:hypothetical protein